MTKTLGEEIGEFIQLFIYTMPSAERLDTRIGSFKVSIYRVGKTVRVDIHPEE